MKTHVHVVPGGRSWKIKRECCKKASFVRKSQSSALRKATRLAKKSKVEKILHGKHGRILRRDSYGHDPFPPRG